MKVKGIIFDADGTLLDSMSIWKNLASNYIKNFNIIDTNIDNEIFSMTLEESSLYLKNKYKLPLSNNQIQKEILDLISDFYKYDVKLKKGVTDFLKAISNENIKMVITTSGDKNNLELALKRLGILEYFEKIFYCSEFKTNKNSPYIYETAMNYLNLGKKEICIFEDSSYAIKTAKRNDFIVVSVNNTDNLLADLCIKDFTDIKLYKYIFNN